MKPNSRAGKPVVIADYDPAWPLRFQREREMIIAACGPDLFVAVEHVGSTSVPGLAAKPIIDLMPGVRTLADVTPAVIERLASVGYAYGPETEHDQPGIGPGTPERRYFRKVEGGERVCHVHVVEVRGEWWVDTVLFRDYLRAHPETAQEYAELKRRLAAEFNEKYLPHNVNINVGYTEYKSDFVLGVLAKARDAARDSVRRA